jgi:hypothetical protein
VSTVVALGAGELLARLAGYRPRVVVDRPELHMHAPDPVLGWRPVPGHYRFGPYSPGAAPVDVTIRSDGARESGPAGRAGRPRVVLVGCSFTMGWAVSDAETWAWQLQTMRPDLEVVNRGVGGYGTLQSMLLLEQLARDERQRPARVLYGFIDHSLRNVAAPLWLWALSYNEPPAATPYCTLGPGGDLVSHAPAAYPSLPLHQHSALVALLEKNLAAWQARSRTAYPVRVTQLLLQEMNDRSRKAGVGFSLVFLHVPESVRATYGSFAREHQIDVIDCNRESLTPADVVRGEVHPNGAVHRRWAECIAAALAEPARLPPREGEEP